MIGSERKVKKRLSTLSTSTRANPEPRRRYRPRWWREVIYILVLYFLYSFVRNLHGSVLSVTTAQRNAQRVVDAERFFHLFHEKQIQHFFLPHTWLIKTLNIYYGTAHFIVTIGVLLWLYHLQTDRYRHWRNVLFATTGLALIGYMTFPLAPPRLLPPSFGFVDTIDTIGGLWSFNSGAADDISNQYAAMPSLHVGWSLWCALAIMPVLRHSWSRVLIAIYPAITTMTIVITANHYWADVFGGALVFFVGYMVSSLIERLLADRQRSESDTVLTEGSGGHSISVGDSG